MFKDSLAFSGFSTDNLAKTKDFYSNVLGLEVEESPTPTAMLTIHLATGGAILAYPKDDHQAATFTILNFPVDNIDAAVAELTSKGVTFEKYDGMTDGSGVARGLSRNMGPDIAWFKDPAGNVLSILQQA